jgi:uncharacterized protein YndB with AHSA1/START domain
MNANATETTRSIGKMTLTLPSDTEIVMTRVFDAPRARVFAAHASCEHVRAWWGPHGHTMPECHMDFREGGTWRFVNRDAQGNTFTFFGEYREIVEPERIAWTFGFEGMPGEPGLETLTLTEQDGRTILTTRSFFPSIEARDATIATGMERGAAETWDRLEEHLGSVV